jgi:bifunctional DNA-binding transcriptional regulator/antitoxin component of YhaV-PrlF toxin-antitoxin module
MAEAYVSPEGVVTIPEKFRAALGLENGGRVEFVQFEDGELTMIALTLPAEALRGILGKPRRHYTIEQMDEIVGRCVAQAAK